MRTKFVDVHHPKIPGSNARVSKRAFDSVWKDKGFVEGHASEEKQEAKQEAPKTQAAPPVTRPSN